MSGKRKKVALVSSHGGHLTEILALREVFEGHDAFFITYEGTSSATLSPAHRIKKFHDHPLRVFTVWAEIFSILKKERPDIIFSTGAEIAIPVFYLAKLFFRCRLVYLECSAQVATPSLTGRIVYPIADLFLVQWEPLLAKYGPRALYRGGLI